MLVTDRSVIYSRDVRPLPSKVSGLRKNSIQRAKVPGGGAPKRTIRTRFLTPLCWVALNEFAQIGLDIARKAGISKGAVYLYFSFKRSLLGVWSRRPFHRWQKGAPGVKGVRSTSSC
ncbi:MAG: helix-turn-helix transcriptional regulator [Hyphomicrobiaceae bacterium]|nr:helix-turn-helix transcriptional regulator [Hyphomicrobiaceae bacterium]